MSEQTVKFILSPESLVFEMRPTGPAALAISYEGPLPMGVPVVNSDHPAPLPFCTQSDTLTLLKAQLAWVTARAEKAEQEHAICMGLLDAAAKEAGQQKTNAERSNALLREISQITDQPFTEQDKNLPAWVMSLLATRPATARAEGAKAERDRIISIFSKGISYNSAKVEENLKVLHDLLDPEEAP